MKQIKVCKRRDSTLFRIPFYPDAINGAVLRIQLKNRETCEDVVNNDNIWWNWLNRLLREGYVMQPKYGYYSRPRTKDDLQFSRRLTAVKTKPGMTLARQIALANQKILAEMS